MTKYFAIGAVAVGALALFAGCSSSSGTTTTGTPNNGTSSGSSSGSGSTSACDSCLEAQCPTEAASCQADEACVACENDNATFTATTPCVEDNANASALFVCASNECSTICGLMPTGGGSSSGGSTASCETCLETDCGSQYEACANDQACVDCDNDNATPTATTPCVEDDPTTRALFSCASDSCSDPCGL